MAKSFNGADFDDSVLALLDPEIVQHWKALPAYPLVVGTPILDFNTDCTSGQLEPGDIGNAPPPKRGRLCKTCCFFAGIPEEQVPEMTVSLSPQDLVLVV
jgi:hypothetical protein